MKKYLLFLVLFCACTGMDFALCQTVANVESGNIDCIHSEITLVGNNLILKNKLTPRSNNNGVVRFYMPPKSSLGGFNITNQQGDKLKYRIDKLERASLITVQVEENQSIWVDYKLKIPTGNQSTRYFKDANQCFILPEMPISPKNNAKTMFDGIRYSVKITEATGEYNYANEIPDNSTFPPTIICGNFKVEQFDGVRAYIPANIEVDRKRLDDIVSIISGSYNYYAKNFGRSIFSPDLQLFFLKRRGGHGLPNGLILNQEYISKNNSSFAKEELVHVAAHEIAHLWWGIAVKVQSPTMSEGLAEFSTDLYLTDTKKRDSRDIYANKNSVVLESTIKPIDIENLDTRNQNYRAISYNKLPIIFHEMELKTGRSNVIKALSNFYEAEKQSEKRCSFDDIFSYFPTQYRSELKKDVDGTLEDWPDYYIKNVTDDTVIFGSNHILFPEIVPVVLTTDKSEVIKDTIYFNAGDTEIVKHYPSVIERIVIDSDFSTNQSLVLNDLWLKNPKLKFKNKLRYSYPPKYQSFFDTILNYLFTTEDVSIEDLASGRTASLLSQGKRKLARHNIICGAYLSIKQNQSFRITVTYAHHGGFGNVWIVGFYEERNNSLYLKKITIKEQ